MTKNLRQARKYLAALERGVDRETLARFFDENVVQEEFPNRLVPDGATRDLSALLDGHEHGKQLMADQRFAVENSLAAGDQVVLEVRWSGTLARPLGSLPAGYTMRARFAVFLRFRDGKIVAQRNYDCFEPWPSGNAS
jgi:ketosteroid isomerase-like protein